MRLVPFVALLATVSGAYQLSGSLNTPGNEPLAGVTVSLAVAGASTVTAADGSWQLGGVTGLSRSARTDLRVARHLSVANGRIRLDWSGRDIAGRHGFTPSSTAMPGAAAGRTAGTNDDTLVFTWRSARIGAIPVRLDSVYSLQLRLDTAVELPAPRVRVSRYDFEGHPILSFVLTNDGGSAMDSLTVRLFLRGKDTLAAKHYQSTLTGQIEVPMLFGDAFGSALDICQAYGISGYNRPCDDPSLGVSWTWGTMANAVRALPLLRLDGSDDSFTGTALYALDIPLGPLVVVSGGRVRFDAMLLPRSEFGRQCASGLATDLANTVQAWLPGRRLPVAGDRGWYDLIASVPLPRPILTGDSARFSPDWSLRSHGLADGSPRDYTGIPTLSKNAMDQAWASQSPNPYICVYRKGVLVSGYPPVVGRD